MMKKTILFLTSLLLILLTACTQEAVDVKSEIEAANEIFMAAINAGDAEALEAVYLPDATVYPPNYDAVSGAENIIPMMTGMAAMGVSMKFETVSAMAYGTTAIEDGKYKVIAGEDMVVDHGKYIVVWKKKGDTWMISMDIWNTSIPVPEPVQETEEIIEE